MYQFQSLDDTIAAIATPAGVGGVGIVRISGCNALRIADGVFRCKNGKLPSEAKSFSVQYGWVVDGPEIMDEALLTIMRGPKSYTAQDVVEINCHGGSTVVRAVLDLVLSRGVRLAQSGEFTKRAFLNGRIDLAQAEAVADIINAKTQAFARISQNQLKGELSTQLESIRAELMSIYITLEALINFPEDELNTQGRQQIVERIQAQANKVSALLDTAHNGRILKEGIRIVLCGKPNVGKSSLLNVLLKQDRAIVTNIAGTTRDVLEEPAQINGLPLQLIDTAGILEPRDLIEEEAIRRSHLFIESADLVLLVLDASVPLDAADQILIEKLKNRPVVVVLNKSDLPQALGGSLPSLKWPLVKVSALHKVAIASLEEAIIKEVLNGQEIDPYRILISNIRHIQALKAMQACVLEANQLMLTATSWEFVSQDLKDAVNHLDSITGRNIDEDLLNRIFSEFCIGK